MHLLSKDLLRFDVKPFLLGVLFSRIMPSDRDEIPKSFYVYTNFRTSKAVNFIDFDFIKYSDILKEKYNVASGYENWIVHRVSESTMELRFYIQNDLEIKTTDFYNMIYKKTMQETWMYTEDLCENKKMFIRGFMETRGSIDLTRPYISQDYFYNNRFELKRAQILTDLMDIPYGYLNFNPRNLQGDFVSGIQRRNTQFRINIHYYAKEIGFINEYKALIYEKAWNKNIKTVKNDIITYDVTLPKVNNSISFIKQLNFFTNNIYEKELTPVKIEMLRDKLNFNKEDNESSKSNRNRTIIGLFDSISPDRCGLCGTEETFINKDKSQAFEIHHVIPYHNGKHYDNIANLIKLCATCHSSLKRGRSTKESQLKSLVTILHKHPEIFEYTSSALGIENINELAMEIYSMLG